jgi:hypothetical protein
MVSMVGFAVLEQEHDELCTLPCWLLGEYLSG